MEERLVLSTTAMLGNVTISDLVIHSGSTQTGPLETSGQPKPGGPGLQAPNGGDFASVTFTLSVPYTGPDIKVGVADYISATYPYGSDVQGWLDKQVYFASSSGILNAANPTVTLNVNLAHCHGDDFYQQIDCFAGQDAIKQFAGSNYYGFGSFGSAPLSLIGGAVIGCEEDNGPGGNFSKGYYAQQHQYALPEVMLIGGRPYLRADLVTLLNTNPAGGNATLINVQQLITAKANLNGTPPSGVASAISQSDAILSTLDPLIIGGVYNEATFQKSSTANGKLLTSLGGYLDKNFNFA